MTVIVLFFLLSVKHFLFDFPFQTARELEHKGNYGDLKGVTHSYKHGLGTWTILVFFMPTWSPIFGLADFLTHYFIDLTKVKASKGLSPADKKFWTYLGLDQLAHYTVYAIILSVYLILHKKGY